MRRDGERIAPSDTRPGAAPIVRARRFLLKARDAFYERRFAETVERCQEALSALLPPGGPGRASPEEQRDLFLGAFASRLPVLDLDGIAAVFTFFERRREGFRFERGRPLPEREWWRMLNVTREEAAAALGATRIAVEAVGAEASGPPRA